MDPPRRTGKAAHDSRLVAWSWTRQGALAPGRRCPWHCASLCTAVGRQSTEGGGSLAAWQCHFGFGTSRAPGAAAEDVVSQPPCLPQGRIRTAVHRRRRGGTPPWTPPPPPPLPMLEADGQNFASAPSAPRGFTLKNFRPAFGSDHRGSQGGGVSQPNPPSDPPSPPFYCIPPPSHRGLEEGQHVAQVWVFKGWCPLSLPSALASLTATAPRSPQYVLPESVRWPLVHSGRGPATRTDQGGRGVQPPCPWS